jgi:DDE superfamily endonuclease
MWPTAATPNRAQNWGSLNAHISAAMAKLIAARDWPTVGRLPAYVHELNPVEGVWSCLKRSLANLAKSDLGQLTALARTGSDGCSTGPAFLTASSPVPGSTSHPLVTPTIEVARSEVTVTESAPRIDLNAKMMKKMMKVTHWTQEGDLGDEQS